MARVTVEDCILKIPNRFELVMQASYRAREISGGVPEMVRNDQVPFDSAQRRGNILTLGKINAHHDRGMIWPRGFSDLRCRSELDKPTSINKIGVREFAL